MSHSLNTAAVLDALQALDRLDRERRIFGSQGHHYRLNPRVPEATIDTFEHEHRLRLPEDYRYFVTEIGNGGAGPSYGLFPFGMHDDGNGLGRWEDGFLLGDISAEFPHKAAWNLPGSFWERQPRVPSGTSAEEQERLWDEWDRTVDLHCWNPQVMCGAIPICHRGCALRQWLVLQGPLKGTVWDDDRADRKGVRPLVDEHDSHITFAGWYLSWLEDATAEASAIRHKRD